MAKGWRTDQKQDYYFRKAKAEGYRARSAYKLLEINTKFNLIRPGSTVLDLGAAPGGWSQVISQLAGPSARVVAVDIQSMAPIPGVQVMRADITDPNCTGRIQEALGQDADVVVSDAAPNVSGIGPTDQARSIELAIHSLGIASRVLRKGGAFLVKLFRGEDFDNFVSLAKRYFQTTRTYIPEASRKESREAYLVCMGLHEKFDLDASTHLRELNSPARFSS